MMVKFKPDLSKPADVKLTKRQKQVLEYVRNNPGCVAENVAAACNMRFYWALQFLEALERFRWIRNTESGSKGSRWAVIDYPKMEAE